MLKTKLTEFLGIKAPIQCGTMQWLSTADLIAAVAEAGGLACLAAATFPDKAALRAEIAKVQQLTSRPFGVNISLFPSLASSDIAQTIQTVIDARVKIVETSGRSPEPYRQQIKGAGLIHIHKCARVKDALRADRLGVDIISIVGAECGGHPGADAVSTLVLVPQVAEQLSRPLIAGGGFCDGRSLAAGLAMGADAVNMGTRFILSRECSAHPRLKEAYLQAGSSDTSVIMNSLRNPGRVLRTAWTGRVAELEKEGAELDQLRPLISGALAQRGWADGSVEEGLYYAGQAVGRCQDLPSVKQLIDSAVAEAEAIIERLHQGKNAKSA